MTRLGRELGVVGALWVLGAWVSGCDAGPPGSGADAAVAPELGADTALTPEAVADAVLTQEVSAETDLAAAPEADLGPEVGGNSDPGPEEETSPADVTPPEDTPLAAFFYQVVGTAGAANQVRPGSTTDSLTVDSQGGYTLQWTVTPGTSSPYGDPVMSRLVNGRWAMTARSGEAHPEGPWRLLYHESDCPSVVDDDVLSIGPSAASGCVTPMMMVGAKVSQIFSVDGSGAYLFLTSQGWIYLVYLGDPTAGPLAPASICLKKAGVSAVGDLAPGEATFAFNGSSATLTLSDTAIARRADGTWELFITGKAEGAASGGGLAELCARNIYRATSTDLIHWSAMELLVERAGIPEAYAGPSGTIWLYWQDFGPACDAGNPALLQLAPISAAYEDAGGSLSAKNPVSFPDEAFQTDSTLHYATNPNPVALLDTAAREAFLGCLAEDE